MEPEGADFRPSEPYTRRLRRIFEEYPDGSQVLREILQNSDDAKSTEQIFILDHNTYSSNKLFKSELQRFQGPALLAINSEIFEERDFDSLLKLSDSEKHDQFDKIGVMGVGFNSIYHITDSPSFITGDKYVILDPHEWYYKGGKKFNFVADNLAKRYPGQFAPFIIPSEESSSNPFKTPFNGTIFRYPLRDNDESDISKKIYKPQEILDMFHKFYENESINCLLFLKYIERIRFYELKEGANNLELLYTIQLENADEVQHQRRLISESIVPLMNLLNSKNLNRNYQLDTSSYVASFSRKKKRHHKETNYWLVLNYLDSLLEAEAYFQKKFKRNIGDYKFIPNVGLALPLGDLDVTGKLFCFLPLPVNMPFQVSVHGYFAVSTNRRTLWSAADNEDLAVDASARLKVKWNHYLFEKVLPKAWAKFLRELPSNVPNIQPNDVNKFWPIVNSDKKSVLSNIFCKDLLQNVITNLDIKDHVFKGPSTSNTIGTVDISLHYTSSFQESEFYWLSIYNGYLEDEKWPIYDYDLYDTIENIGFPIILNSRSITGTLKNSRHKDFLKLLSPEIIRTYLKSNHTKWEHGVIERNDVLKLFKYILQDKKFSSLEGFQNDSAREWYSWYFDTIKKFKLIDKSIDSDLYKRLYKNAKAGWNLNIKILDESAVADMIKYSLDYERNKNYEEIQINNNNREWIYQLWDILIKLKTPTKIFSSKASKYSFDNYISIFEKFGAVFVDNGFDIEWDKINPYIIKLDDIISVLTSFQANPSYPNRKWYLLPFEEVNSYGKIIYPSQMGGFLDTSSKYLCYILEDIIKIPRLDVNNYWRNCVIPFLEMQSPKDIDIVVDKLFNRFPDILDERLKNDLGKLFDPEKKKVNDLFFEDERVFPAGKYGISRSFFDNKFLENLKKLGIKTSLTTDDIIFRINTIMKRKQSSNIQDFIHINAKKLFKYIDENWIICFVAPILEYNIKNVNFLKLLNWNIYPNVDMVLKQLTFCCESVTRGQSPKELELIYTFRSTDEVVIDLPDKLTGSYSLVTKLPKEYNEFINLFKSMGIRDEIGIKDLILAIRNTAERNENKNLSIEEINNIVQVLDHIVTLQMRITAEENDPERLDNEEKSKYMIAHPLVSQYIAKKLNMQTLTGKICDTGDSSWEPYRYEQNESLTTRIKNIIKEYLPNQIIREFLQNADDAKATRFSVIVDRRKYTNRKESLLTEEMKELQGPAIWIYNDAEFSEKDFQALINLGIGGKSHLPSFVSGETIAFIDPHAKFLPATGYPPKKLKGIRMNFIEKEFKKRFPDQCYPYEAIESCDFTKKFKGTLFRLPLRTKRSKISSQVLEINEILRLFYNVESNKEMLFLRNIESCSLYDMKEQGPNLIWQAKLIISTVVILKIIQCPQKVSEIWAICTGGHNKIKSEFKELKEFSQKERIKPRGGVASLLARSDEKSLDELKAESFPNPPVLRGEIFSYLSLSMISNLGVHLNGNFSLSSSRLQSENDFLKSDCDDAKWNRYILLEVLPDLHIKLFEYIVELEEARHLKESTNFIPHTTKIFGPSINI
ncbi:unnamed protein product [Rhizophagus irregularis]|nr:unnamed protein product [Rhizophagus irregularis]